MSEDTREPLPVLVSVVIPCFNQARYLGTAIESALANTPGPREVIVVDDGSTDGSGAVIRRYREVRCLSQANGGVSRARNAGLAVASGEFVVFLDGDDWLLPGGVELNLSLLRAHPASMMAAGHYQLVAPNGDPLPTPQPDNPPQDPYMELLRRSRFGIGGGCPVLFRRSLFETIEPFATEVEPAADYELYLRTARSFPISVHTTPVVAYRRHPAGMSRRPEVMLEAVIAVMRSQRPFLDQREGLRLAYHEGCAHWLDYYGSRTRRALLRDLCFGRVRTSARRMRVLARVTPLHLETRRALRRLRAS